MKLIATGAKVNDHEFVFVDPEQEDAWKFWTSRGYVPEGDETVEEVEEEAAAKDMPAGDAAVVEVAADTTEVAEVGAVEAMEVGAVRVLDETVEEDADEASDETVDVDDEEGEGDTDKDNDDLLSIDFDAMTVAELQVFVDAHDIDVSLSSHPLKAEKIAAVRKAIAAR